MEYRELAEEIIKHEATALGMENAVKLARDVDGIKVSDDGTVTRFSGDKETIGSLADVYIGKLGNPARVSIKTNVASNVQELDLPDNLA
ncbi:MAG: hypothetical protein ABEJ69_03070 [Candidatus Nanohaloarchaea archaeon]